MRLVSTNAGQCTVTLIGATSFRRDMAAEAIGWAWEKGYNTGDAEGLTEFAGRSCYQSWARPNPATATNADYLAHIEQVGHWSVMEHGSVTFYIQGVSRSLTHELVRHRHLSPSQLSQRFVVLDADVSERSTDDFVVPPLFANDKEAGRILLEAWENAVDAYAQLYGRATQHLGAKRKQAAEAARAVLPNMTPTAIVLTGNHRAWREMLMKRLQPEADAEIRNLALLIFELLSAEEPALYQDLEVWWAGIDIPALRKRSAPCVCGGVKS